MDLAPRNLWGRPVIVGGGVAGAVTALTLAPQPMVMLDSAPAGTGTASRWAQGGLAAAVGPDDSPAIHAEDTLKAGAGLTDPAIAMRIAGAGPEAVAALEQFGVHFDRAPSGAFALGLEAAHSRRRILHVHDATGDAILNALMMRVGATDSVAPLSGRALRLVVEDARIAGIVIGRNGKLMLLPTAAVVLATGGIGGLWRSTTNPAGALGSGIMLAARAGATLADLEFVQFHPTALAVGIDPMPLISEAVRGEGARLIDAAGNRFMAETPGGDLAPRDIVARAVFGQWAAGGHAALDARGWPAGQFAALFPTIHQVLSNHGLDPERDPIPVRTAAHYHMGGVLTGPTGRTSIEGLWACGEVACTGLHGANRLASNSLLEAAVCGRFVAGDIAGLPAAAPAPPHYADLPPQASGDAVIAAMRDLMDRDVGVVREKIGLERALAELETLRAAAAGTSAEDPVEIAMLIAGAALRRSESRGAHYRSDAGPPVLPPEHSRSVWSPTGRG
jgi:L-aspartate oxidase